jgi:HD-GYP domain-containing protein (c-di-GMP phosphodiesterase class II)
MVTAGPGDYREIAMMNAQIQNPDVATDEPAASSDDPQWLREQVKRLSEESESLAFQVVQGLEEVSLLRWVAERLELPDFSGDPPELAPGILAEILSLVEADGVLLAQCKEGESNETPVITALTWQGRRVLSDELTREWLLLERHRARERALIRNKIAQSKYAERFPDLREFVLVEVRNKAGLAGWLAACNCAPKNPHRKPYDWEGFTTVEATLLTTVSFMLAAHFHNVELVRQRESLLTNLVRALVNAIDARDPYTCGHSERVASFARRLGKEAGLGSGECERLYLSGLLHDVGKIGIPDALLGKPGRLTEDEFRIFTKHPEAGWDILHELDALKHVLPGVLHHHERIDGGGYPDGLAGEAIPLDGRILAICDAYDAMTSDRPYRKGMPQEQAETILRDGAGSQWDARLVAMFMAIMPDILAIRSAYRPRTHTPRLRTAT